MSPRPGLLGAAELAAALPCVPEWEQAAPGSLRRTVRAASFPAAVALVDAVAIAAEELDHHPDIDIRWRTVTFVLTTHSAGGLTSLDFQLARRIDQLIEAG